MFESTASANISGSTVQLTLEAAVLLGISAAGQTPIRRTVVDALWRCGLVPLLSSEALVPQADLEAAHAYVDVLTQPLSRSAEQALQQALAHKLPIFLFVSADLAQDYRKYGTVIPFKASDDLGALLVQQFTTLLTSAPQASLSLHPPHTDHVPTIPAPYVAHSHYSARRLVGRAAELDALRAWSSSTTPVLLLTGAESIGKSALVWHWLLEERLKETNQPLMLWDFAESNGGFANFVRHALAYFLSMPLDAVNDMPRAERLPLLLQTLAKTSALLVLERAERLLSAYNALFTLQTVHSSEAPPANAEIAAFLDALPTFSALKTILVTRLKPQGYADRSGVQSIALYGLSEADAVQLFAQLVPRCAPQTVETCIETLERHPLALCMVAESGKAHPNGFEEWWRSHAAHIRRTQRLSLHLELLIEDAHIIGKIESGARMILDILAVQRFPVPHWLLWQALQNLPSSSTQQQAVTQARLHTMLHDLERCGLLLWDRATNRYTLPQSVRRYMRAACPKVEREMILSAVERTYTSLLAHIPEALHDESDLRAATELYCALLQAGKAEEAAIFYRQNLSKPLLGRLADWHTALQLLTPFFAEGTHASLAVGSVKERAYLGHEMALILTNLARLPEARQRLEQTLPLFIESDMPEWLCTALINYGNLIQESLALRVRTFELARRLAALIGAIEDQAAANFILLRDYVEIGYWTAAAKAYEEFSASPARYRTLARQAAAECLVAQMLLAQGQDPSGALNLAWEIAAQGNAIDEKRTVYALWGEIALALMNRPDAAERFFEETLLMANSDARLIAHYRGGLARAYAMQGRREEALVLLAKGVPSLAAAQVHLMLGNAAQAESAALEAYRQAWAEGTPFSHWWQLEQARTVLRQLQVPPPDLPSYQPDKVPKLPHEQDIRAYLRKLEHRGQNKPAPN
ncbi:MAG: ATP-binding protein [Anaerolineae bacterium]|nr:ATP-binding protein [Anaerolineae bacterium]MDW8300615.1 ATP-binding protein [Anaerolineae bacterium]